MYSWGTSPQREEGFYLSQKTAAPGDPEATRPINPTLSLIPTIPLPQYTVLEGDGEPGRLVTSMPPASWGVVKASLNPEPLRANWGKAWVGELTNSHSFS